jgi:hypothetical protein
MAATDSPKEPYVVRVITDYHLDTPCAEDHVIGAIRYIEVDPNTDGERVLYDNYECVPIPWSVDYDGDPIPDPRGIDVRDAVSRQLPTPTFAVNPYPEGLTGLESWFWYDDDGASSLEPIDVDGTTRPGLTVTATAGPYSITAQAWITHYRWETGDGAVYTSTRPGTEDDPAASHIYETKGDYTVAIETVWVGTYTWTAGSFSGSGDLGSVTRRSTHDYRVVEARSVLVP